MGHAKLSRAHTERRTPIPAKITFAGGNSCHIDIRVESRRSALFGAYQANSCSKRCRECMKDVHGWIKPFCPSLIAIPRLIQPLNLLLQHSANGTGIVAGLELGGERVCKEIPLCAFFVLFQGIVDY